MLSQLGHGVFSGGIGWPEWRLRLGAVRILLFVWSGSSALSLSSLVGINGSQSNQMA